MADLTAQRTLVKSPPELWSELSEVESLAKHLGELGEIRITKVEPETTVAWEGEEVSGTVELEQSGWGTKVTFRATVPEPEPVAEQETEHESEPEAVVEPEIEAVAEPEIEAVAEPEPEAIAKPEPVATEPTADEIEPSRQGFLARWLFRRRQPARATVAAEAPPTVEPQPIQPDPEPIEPEPEPLVAVAAEPTPEPTPTSATHHVQQILDGTLDALGQAHHRPFSRG